MTGPTLLATSCTDNNFLDRAGVTSAGTIRLSLTLIVVLCVDSQIESLAVNVVVGDSSVVIAASEVGTLEGWQALPSINLPSFSLSCLSRSCYSNCAI